MNNFKNNQRRNRFRSSGDRGFKKRNGNGHKLNVDFSNDGVVETCDGLPHMMLGDSFKRKNADDPNLIYVMSQMMGFKKYQGSKSLILRGS